jgi:hypothetical protein
MGRSVCVTPLKGARPSAFPSRVMSGRKSCRTISSLDQIVRLTRSRINLKASGPSITYQLSLIQSLIQRGPNHPRTIRLPCDSSSASFLLATARQYGERPRRRRCHGGRPWNGMAAVRRNTLCAQLLHGVGKEVHCRARRRLAMAARAPVVPPATTS